MALFRLLIALGLCKTAFSFHFVHHSADVGEILEEFASNSHSAINLFTKYRPKSIGDAFVYAASCKSIEFMQWLAASTTSDSELLDEALWQCDKMKSFYKVAARAGLYDLAAKALKPSRPDGILVIIIMKTAIKLGVYNEVKGKLPLECIDSFDITRVIRSTLRENKCFFDLMDDLNQRLIPVHSWRESKTIELASKATDGRIIKYLQIYRTYYQGRDYKNDVLKYYNEFKDDKEMLKAIWANLHSMDNKLIDDRSLRIRIEDIVESIPLLGRLKHAVESGQPALIDYALKHHGEISANFVSTLWKAESYGLWYVLQNEHFRQIFVRHFRFPNMHLNELISELGLDKYHTDYPGIIRSMQYLGRALIVAHSNLVPSLQPQILSVMYRPSPYMSSCLYLANFTQFTQYAEAAKTTRDYCSPLKHIRWMYSDERKKANGNFEVFCKEILDGSAMEAQWDRLALAKYGKLCMEDMKALVELSLEKGDFDIAYVALQRMEEVEKIRCSDPKFYSLLVKNIAKSYKSHFNPYPKFIVEKFNIGPSELASSVSSEFHYLVGRLMPEVDLMSLQVADSELVLVHIVMILTSGDERRIAALERILPYINSMNSVQLLHVLNLNCK